MTAGQDARALLHQMTGQEPDGLWSAPGRVNLIGEHTDYNDGFVLPFAIDDRTAVAATRRDDHQVRITTTFDPDVVEVDIGALTTLFPSPRTQPSGPHWSAYPLGVAWAMLAVTPDPAHLTGVDIAIASDVPTGAGLSSSAALENAVASALNDLWSVGADKIALARVGHRAENEAVGAPTGVMDQMASMLGEPDSALFLDCRTLGYDIVPLGFDAAGLDLVIIDTRVKHSHSTGGYRQRRATCERGAQLMGVLALRDLDATDLPRAQTLMDDATYRCVRHVVTENQRVLDTVDTLRSSCPRSIGDILVASHKSMRDDLRISIPELDAAVTSALTAGAVGARMTGGGFGGAAIALIDREKTEELQSTVIADFQRRGFRAPVFSIVSPSPGARRDAD